jgi:putative membrane protein
VARTAAPGGPLTPPEDRPLPPALAGACGLLMGAADAVPGVSGGTIALLLGIYERFVEAVHAALRFPVLLASPAGRARLAGALRLLGPLAAGLLLAWWGATLLLVGPAESPGLLRRRETAPYAYAFFLGLVLVGVSAPWRRIARAALPHVALAATGAAAAFLFTGLPQVTEEPRTWMLLYGGALAVSVMLLPGVSGSMLLVVLGQYAAVAGAVHDRDLARVGVFAAGVGLGILLFVPVLRALLRRRHDATMALLTGLMAGSTRALWPWKENYDLREGPLVNAPAGSGAAWVLVALAAGAAAVWLLGRLERRVRAADAP